MNKNLLLIFTTVFSCCFSQDNRLKDLYLAIDRLDSKKFIALIACTDLTKEDKESLLVFAQAQVEKRKKIAEQIMPTGRDLVSTGIGSGLIALGSTLSYMLATGNKNIIKKTQKFSSYIEVVADQIFEEESPYKKYIESRDDRDKLVKRLIHASDSILISCGFWHIYSGLTRQQAHKNLADAQALAGCIKHMCA